MLLNNNPTKRPVFLDRLDDSVSRNQMSEHLRCLNTVFFIILIEYGGKIFPVTETLDVRF